MSSSARSFRFLGLLAQLALFASMQGCTLSSESSSAPPSTSASLASDPSTAANDAQTATAVAATSRAVLAASTGAHRSAAHIARNADRHPVETLAFFGLEDDMTVVEALPGAELWYTEILAPVLREKGKLIAASVDPETPGIVDYQKNAHMQLLSRIAAEPEIFGAVGIAKLSPPDRIDLGPDGSADMVVTFRATHGWLNAGVADQVYAAFHAVLKPGGVLGIEQHRAGPKTNREAFSGYVPEETVIAIAERAGFVLEARSEINANPKDTADHPGGVWSLPPSLRLGDRDRARYVAIGESDRMTLRFRKPAKS